MEEERKQMSAAGGRETVQQSQQLPSSIPPTVDVIRASRREP